MSAELTELKRALTATFDGARERLSSQTLRARIDEIQELERDRRNRLAFFIGTQIDNFERVGEYVAANLHAFPRIQALAIQVRQLSQENIAESHLDADQMRQISTLKRNLSAVLERLSDFVGVDRRLSELTALQDKEDNFMLIQDRLDALLALEGAVAGKAFGRFGETFEKVHSFRKQFLERVLSAFDEYVESCQSAPQRIRHATAIFDRADTHEKGAAWRDAALARLGAAVVRRFEEKLGDKNEIQQILENVKFSVDDLLVVHASLHPLFSARYALFAFMESAYKAQIEVKVLPVLQDFEYLKANPGTIVYLINWLNTYETLLTRAGIETLSFGTLRERIRGAMPFFTAHVEAMFADYLKNIAKQDDELFGPNAVLDGVLETSTPEDALHFLNEQAAFLGRYLDEELMAKLFAVWLSQLRAFCLAETRRFSAAVNTPEKILLLCIGANNFSKLGLHLISSRKGIAATFATEVGRERLDQLFGAAAMLASQQTEILIGRMALISFADVEREKLPLMFREEWQSDPLATILNTISDYYNAVAPLLRSAVHSKLYLRRMIERYFVCYFEAFGWAVKSAFYRENILSDFRPENFRVSAGKAPNAKSLESFIRQRAVVKSLLARDAATFRAFLAPLRAQLNEAFAAAALAQSDYLSARLFGAETPAAIAAPPQFDEAANALRSRMR